MSAWTSAATPLTASPQVAGLAREHQEILNRLVDQLRAKTARNALRRRYYDHRAVLKDLGISIPPQMRDVETVLGWPAKAVDTMSRRTVLDGFTMTSGSTADIGLDELWDENRMASEVPQAHTSALIHSTAFVFVTAGDTAAGEPQALISVRSAEWATGIWDARRRQLSAALSVASVDDEGQPDHMVMYLPNLAIIMRREGTRWDLRQSRHTLGIPVEHLPYRPALDRPFGSSRISRPVMSLTDSAVRTLLRSEVSAEFFSAPQRYVLGADEETFVDEAGNPIPAWQAILGRMFSVSKDEDGDVPTVGQFPQQSMEPHLAQLRSLATLFAGETSIPVGALGIIQDNPSSAEAIYAAKEELVVEIQHWESTSLGPAWERTARNALRLIDDSPAARRAYAGIRAHWRNPATASIVSASDAMVKQIAAIPKIGETDVALEKLGYDQAEIERMQAQWRRSEGRQAIAALASIGEGAEGA